MACWFPTRATPTRSYISTRKRICWSKSSASALQNGEKVQKEYLYGDYKDFDGVKLPTKLTENVNGKKFTEITGATYKLLKSVDDATFGKP